MILQIYTKSHFYWGRYKFRVRGEWFGIVHQIYAKLADVNNASGKELGRSSWLDDVSWDSAIKWKIELPSLLTKSQQFPFNRIFKGLNQINKKAFETILHVWIETDYCVENRQEAMLDLFHRLEENGKDFFGWLVLNDLYFDVSPKGYFDLIENANIIQGPLSKKLMPTVTAIFSETVPGHTDMGEFGIGFELPDIDL